MSQPVRRSQVNLHDKRQIRSYKELQPGMRIGVVAVIQEYSRPQRMARVGAALLDAYAKHQPGQSVLEDFRTRLEQDRPRYFVPLWSGEFRGEQSPTLINVLTTAVPARRGEQDPQADPFASLATLSAIEPREIEYSYEDMGLKRIDFQKDPFALEALTQIGPTSPYSGRWLSHVTLQLPS